MKPRLFLSMTCLLFLPVCLSQPVSGQGMGEVGFSFGRSAVESAATVSNAALGPAATLVLQQSVRLAALALVCEQKGNLDEATRLYKQCLEMRARVLGKHDPEALKYVTAVAKVLCRQGKLAEAESFFRQALALTARKYGPGSDELTGVMSSLADICTSEKKYGDAWYYLKQVLTVTEKKVGPSDPAALACRSRLAHACVEGGNLAEAQNVMQPAADMTVPDKSKTQLLAVLDDYGKLLRKNGCAGEAEKIEARVRSLRSGGSETATALPASALEACPASEPPPKPAARESAGQTSLPADAAAGKAMSGESSR